MLNKTCLPPCPALQWVTHIQPDFAGSHPVKSNILQSRVWQFPQAPLSQSWSAGSRVETAALKAASFYGLVWSGTGNWTCGILGFDSTLPLKEHAATVGSLRVERVSSSHVSVGRTEDTGNLRLELRHWVHLLSIPGKALWVLSTVQPTLCRHVQNP